MTQAIPFSLTIEWRILISKGALLALNHHKRVLLCKHKTKVLRKTLIAWIATGISTNAWRTSDFTVARTRFFHDERIFRMRQGVRRLLTTGNSSISSLLSSPWISTVQCTFNFFRNQRGISSYFSSITSQITIVSQTGSEAHEFAFFWEIFLLLNPPDSPVNHLPALAKNSIHFTFLLRLGVWFCLNTRSG